MAIVASGLAQRGSFIVRKDTINLRGRIYEANGSPSAGSMISSKQLDLQYNRYPISARTDSTGYFELKGARPNDTLLIKDPNYELSSVYSSYYNYTSRYIVIYLPQPKINNLNSGNPIAVKATRKNPKIIPSFKIVTDTRIVDDWEYYPSPINGTQKFLEYIQKRLIYPERAVLNNIEGAVEIQFTITRDGSLTNFKVLRGIGYDCDEAVINALKTAPPWRPGLLSGQPMEQLSSVTIIFKLTDK